MEDELAKRATDDSSPAPQIDPSHELPAHVPTGTEEVLLDFAEDLGRLLGTAEKKAVAWLEQRKAITVQLTALRDKANQLLEQLSATEVATAIRRGRGQASEGASEDSARRPKGPGISAATRKKMKEAAEKRWAAIKKARGHETGNG